MKSSVMAGNTYKQLYTKNRLILLLVIVCIGCLGSLPIAAYLLPSLKSTTSVVPTKTYSEGQCTATPKTILYAPGSSSNGQQTSTLPAAWSQAKRSHQDFMNAQACAATFVEYYQSFDYRNLNTLESAIFMLSSAAKKRFYQGDGNIGANLRLNADWRTQVQQHKLIQISQVSQPVLLDSEYVKGTLYVTFDIPYQLITYINGQTTAQNYHETVLLKGISPDPQQKGTGWQVSDYRESNQ